jgi:RNA polymerase sigma factor (TIGR02999 family)
MSDVTHILSAIEDGDPLAAEQLLPLVYDELRQLAAQRLACEKPGQTLQATALVHEAYLRLVGSDPDRQWNGRSHFFRAAAEAMRRILVDRARHKHTLKRGGADPPCPLPAAAELVAAPAADVLAVHEALEQLAQHDPAKAELVKLRYFVGLSVAAAADVLGISRATADRHWRYARTWLYCTLTRSGAGRRK